MKNRSSLGESANQTELASRSDSDAWQKESLELGITFPNKRCVKGSPCVVKITVHNPADERVEFAGLGIWLRPFQGAQPVDFSGYLFTSVDVVDLARLEPNTFGASLSVGPNETWTKEVDLTMLGWHKSIQSSLSYKPLWERLEGGTYEVRIEVGVKNDEIPPAANANFGGVEVIVTKNENPRSDWEVLEFDKR